MKPTNSNAPVKCIKSITIQAKPEKVWHYLTTINDWPLWQADIKHANLMGNLQPGTAFRWTTGSSKIQSTLHTVEPFKYFGWTGKVFGLVAIHNWTIEKENEGTRVCVDESLEGWLALLFKGSFNKDLERGMQRWLDMLKKVCEN